MAWLTPRVDARQCWDVDTRWLAVTDCLSAQHPSLFQQLLLGTETLPSFVYGETVT